MLSKSLLSVVYDNAKAFSLRDGDGTAGDIADEGLIIKLRLQCRSSENLLLSDDVLQLANKKWDDIVASIDSWIAGNPQHSHIKTVTAFKEGGFDRRNFDLKPIRNVIAGMVHPTKSWEIQVGQAIAQIKTGSIGLQNSLSSYLGTKVIEKVLT